MLYCNKERNISSEKVGLNITPKEFKQLSKWTKNIYNTSVVIDYFVANQPVIEERYNLIPVIEFK